MYQLATAPRGIGQVLDSVFKLARAAWLRMLPYALIAAVLGSVPLVYLSSRGAFDDPQQLATFGISRTYWLLIVAILPLTVCLSAAAVVRMESIAQGADIGFAASVRAALPKIVKLILALIAFMLCLTVGFALLIVPGIILLGSLFLFVPAIMLDGKGPVESLNYSHKLVWGNWWRVATIGAIAVVMFYVVYLLLGVVLALFVGFDGLADPATVFVVDGVASLAGGLIVTAFFYALYVELYREVKMRKTGGDIAARIDATGSAR